MSNDIIEFQNEAQELSFQNSINEIVKGLEALTAEREQINEIIHELYKEQGIPKPVIRKVAKLAYKRNGEDFESDNHMVTELYKRVSSVKAKPSA